MRDPDPMFVKTLEAELGLTGLRTADVPGLADFRRKFRWRFYRLADAGIFLTIFNFIVAVAPENPLWWLSLLVGLPLAVALVWFGENRARAITRQLNRPAAEQIARDLSGVSWD